MAVSVVLFGTLLEADAPTNPLSVLREAVDWVVNVADLVHVGSDPETDGALEAVSGRSILASGRPLAAVAADREVAP